MLSAICVLFIALCGAAYWALQVRQPLSPPENQLQLTVKEGESFTGLMRRLQSEGWQLPLLQMRLYARLFGLDRRIRSGDYSLEGCCDTALELLHLLHSGRQMTHRVTLVEGWDFRRILKALAEQPKLEREASDSPAETADQLSMGYDSVEGLFYPDTYDYASGETDLDVLRRARRRQRELMDSLWENRADNLPYETPYDAIVLASIVEREALLKEEAPRIAGVYVLRLQKGWRLEADPTVIYGLGNDYSRPLTRTDLRTDTPWNTYMHFGLPPTPIGIPGEAALRAALSPEKTDMLYFVARGDGSHVFSKTLKEHRRNIRKIRKARQSRAEQ